MRSKTMLLLADSNCLLSPLFFHVVITTHSAVQSREAKLDSMLEEGSPFQRFNLTRCILPSPVQNQMAATCAD